MNEFTREQPSCVTHGHPSDLSELWYRVQGVPLPVGYPLSPPRGSHWEGFKAWGKVKVDQENVLHQVRGGMNHDWQILHSFLALKVAKLVACGIAPAMYLHRRSGRSRVKSEHLINYKVGGWAWSSFGSPLGWLHLVPSSLTLPRCDLQHNVIWF